MFRILKTPPTDSRISPATHATSRKILRNLPNGYVGPAETAATTGDLNRPVCGPFRAAMNAGDVLGRRFLQCDCPNPLASKSTTMGDSVSHRGCGLLVHGYSTKAAPVANCNPRFVYDSSDYIRFKKLGAQKKGYVNKSRDSGSSGGYVMQRLQRAR
jgi:hypothetical protein